MRIWSCKHTHLFEMMCHLYFSRYKLFNNKYVHIIKPNVLHLNKDFFSFTPPLPVKSYQAKITQLTISRVYRGTTLLYPTRMVHSLLLGHHIKSQPTRFHHINIKYIWGLHGKPNGDHTFIRY